MLKLEWPTPVDFGGDIKSLLTPVPQTAMPTARARRLPVKNNNVISICCLNYSKIDDVCQFYKNDFMYSHFLCYSFKDILPGEVSLACHNSREIKETWPGREMIKLILRMTMDDNTDQDQDQNEKDKKNEECFT